MGLLDGLLGQSGVSATGGGTVYDPTQDNWEIRFDTEGNAYQSRVEAPLPQGHTTDRQEVSTQRFDVPEEPSLLNYGDNYYSGEQFTPQNVAPKPQPTPDLLNQPGVNRVPQEEHDRFNAIHASSNRETRYDGQGNVYQADPRTPLIEGHRKASSFNIPTPEPTEYLGPIGQSYSQGQGQQIPEGAYGSLGDHQTWSRQQAPTTSLRPRDAVESVAQDNRGSIAPWLPEQTNFDDARNLMSSHQGGERIAQRDTGTFKDLTPNVDPSKAMEMMAMFKKEGKALTDLQFEKAMGSFGMSDILEEHRSTMNLSDRDSFGNIIPDANAYEQGVDQALDKANRFQWDSSAKEANISRLGYDPMTEMNAVNGTTPNVIPQEPTFKPDPTATDFWNEGAESTFKTKQAIAKIMGVGEDIVDKVLPMLGNTTPAILMNENHPRHQESKDLFLNLTRGAAQGLLHDLPQGVIDFGVDAINYGANKLGSDDVIDTEKSSKLWDMGYSEDQQKEHEKSMAYNLTKFGSQLGGGYLGLAKVMGNANTANKFVRVLKESVAVSMPGGTLDVTEGNISDLINTTEYKNAVTEMMGSQVGDDASAEDRFVARLKNMGEELTFGMSIPALYGLAKATKSALTDPQAMTRFMENMPGLTPPVELSMSPRMPSEMGMPNMTEAERRMANKSDSSLPYKEADDNSGMQGLLDAAENKHTRIALNEQKADVKAQAQIAQQTQLDAKPKAPIDELGFYSKAEQVILDLKQEKNTPDDIKKYLQKNGVTKSELEDTGLLSMLNSKKASGERVTKTGLLDHIKTNKTRLDETQHVGSAADVDNSEWGLMNPAHYDNVEGTNFVEIADPDNVSGRAVDIFEELTDGDVSYQHNWFDMTDELHKLYPDKYPETRLQRIDRLKQEYTDVGSFSDEGRALEIQIDNLQKIQTQAPERDTWVYDLHNRLADAEGIDNIDDIALRGDLEEATHALAQKEYDANPTYEWNIGSDGNDYTAVGNADDGIMITGPDGNYINDDPIYGINEANIEIQQHAMDYGYMSQAGTTKYADYTQPGLDSDTYREIPITAKPLSEKDYKGGHFDEDNVVGHLRVSDRTDADGNYVLFIEELQSDWHQGGRKSGYLTKESEQIISKLEAEDAKLATEQVRLRKLRDVKRDELYEKYYAEIEPTVGDSYSFPNSEERGMFIAKKAKAKAAENQDYKDMGWDLEVVSNKRIKKYNEVIKMSRKGQIPDAPLKDDKWQEMVFKRAMKIASDGNYDRVAWTNSDQQVGLYHESYRELYENLYDKKLPGYAKRYANKNGSKTGKVEMDFGDDILHTTDVNYIDISPNLKANVDKGQSMYSNVALPTGGLLGGEAQIDVQADEGEGILGVKNKADKPMTSLMSNIKAPTKFTPSNDLLDFVKNFENAPLAQSKSGTSKAYKDYDTTSQGFGSEPKKDGSPMTKAEANKAVIVQLVKANKAVDRLVKVDLNEHQRNALVSMLSNVKTAKFAKSNALKALNNGNIKTFLKEAFDPKIGFVKAGGKVVNGLVRRRAREKSIFTQGNYGN